MIVVVVVVEVLYALHPAAVVVAVWVFLVPLALSLVVQSNSHAAVSVPPSVAASVAVLPVFHPSG